MWYEKVCIFKIIFFSKDATCSLQITIKLQKVIPVFRGKCLMTLVKVSLTMHGRATTARCLRMDRLAVGSLTPWSDMETTRELCRFSVRSSSREWTQRSRLQAKMKSTRLVMTLDSRIIGFPQICRSDGQKFVSKVMVNKYISLSELVKLLKWLVC